MAILVKELWSRTESLVIEPEIGAISARDYLRSQATLPLS